MSTTDTDPTDHLLHVPEMELEWNDLSVILAIGRTGSLSGAARTLKVNHSTIFRRISAIEEKTNVRFFDRLPTGYRMTSAGKAAMQCAERVEAEVLTLGRHILGRDKRLQGKIRITAPEYVSTDLLVEPMHEFRNNNPDILFQIVTTSDPLDLNRREADIAVRVTSAPPEALLGRKICEFRFCVYAAQSYLEQRPEKSLAEHDWVMKDNEVDWLVPLIWKNRALADSRIALTSSLTRGATNAALEGMGVVLLPCFFGDIHPKLIRVTEPIASLARELWVLTHPDLRHTVRVRTAMRHFYEALRKKAPLIDGTKGSATQSKPLSQTF